MLAWFWSTKEAKMAIRFEAKQTGLVHTLKRARRKEIVSMCDWWFYEYSVIATENTTTCLWCIVEAEN